MTLKAVLDTLDELDEPIKQLYKATNIKLPDGKDKAAFALDLEGGDSLPFVVPLRNAHERQKTENQQLRARIAELEAKTDMVPEGFTQDEWDRLRALDAEVKRQNEIDPERKKQHDAEVQSIKSMHQQQLDRLKTAHAEEIRKEREAHGATKTALRGRVVGDDLTKALIEAGVDKRYLKAVKAMLEKSVKVNEDGASLQAVFETDLGETPITEFITQWSQSEEGKLYIPPAQGSGSRGSDGKGGGALDNNPWAKQYWNSTEQGRVFKGDRARADRLAKAAGHKDAVGARIENAK